MKLSCLEFEEQAAQWEELDLAREQALREHAESCVPCASLWQALRELRETFEVLPELEVPAQVLVNIRQQTTQVRERVSWRAVLLELGRGLVQPRMAMALSSVFLVLTVLLNVVGINLRDPGWRQRPLQQISMTVHQQWGRSVRFYQDIRMVYQIEAMLQQLKRQNNNARPQNPAGSSQRMGLTPHTIEAVYLAPPLLPALDYMGRGR